MSVHERHQAIIDSLASAEHYLAHARHYARLRGRPDCKEWEANAEKWALEVARLKAIEKKF